MHLKEKIEHLTKKKVRFETKDLGDKIHVKLHLGGKKVDGTYYMKGERSNTTPLELKEAMLLTYCRNNHINA